MATKYYLIASKGIFRYTNGLLDISKSFGCEKLKNNKKVPDYIIFRTHDGSLIEMMSGQPIVPASIKEKGIGIYYDSYKQDMNISFTDIAVEPILIKESLQDITFKVYGNYTKKELLELNDLFLKYLIKGVDAKENIEAKKLIKK